MNIKKLIATTTGAIAPLAFALPAYACLHSPCFMYMSPRNRMIFHTIEDVSRLLIIPAVIFIFYLIFGVSKLTTSHGNKGKIKVAKKHMIRATIGLTVTLLVYIVLFLVIHGGYDFEDRGLNYVDVQK